MLCEATPLAAEQRSLVGLLLLLLLMLTAQLLPLCVAVLLHWPPPSPLLRHGKALSFS